ncbi:MAG: hypothetical protein GY793_05795 [Proteobacteria bacterium]|nr:hypothetical protein [Pseudomonadota bacterium]
MTRLDKLKARCEKLETAFDKVLLGNRLTKGDVEGLGNAKFQTVSAKTIEAESRLVLRLTTLNSWHFAILFCNKLTSLIREIINK